MAPDGVSPTRPEPIAPALATAAVATVTLAYLLFLWAELPETPLGGGREWLWAEHAWLWGACALSWGALQVVGRRAAARGALRAAGWMTLATGPWIAITILNALRSRYAFEGPPDAVAATVAPAIELSAWAIRSSATLLASIAVVVGLAAVHRRPRLDAQASFAALVLVAAAIAAALWGDASELPRRLAWFAPAIAAGAGVLALFVGHASERDAWSGAVGCVAFAACCALLTHGSGAWRCIFGVLDVAGSWFGGGAEPALLDPSFNVPFPPSPHLPWIGLFLPFSLPALWLALRRTRRTELRASLQGALGSIAVLLLAAAFHVGTFRTLGHGLVSSCREPTPTCVPYRCGHCWILCATQPRSAVHHD